jgi:hypothetical protein
MMRRFKIIASRGAEVVFDNTVEAGSPRQARQMLKQALGLESLSGLVYAITEIPIDLLRALVGEELAKVTLPAQASQGRGRPALDVRALVTSSVEGEIGRLMHSLSERLERLERQEIRPQRVPSPSAGPGQTNGTHRFDPLQAAPPSPPPPAANEPSREIPEALRAILGPDWNAIRTRYEQTRSVKQTAAEFGVSVNTLKARIRRGGWGQ